MPSPREFAANFAIGAATAGFEHVTNKLPGTGGPSMGGALGYAAGRIAINHLQPPPRPQPHMHPGLLGIPHGNLPVHAAIPRPAVPHVQHMPHHNPHASLRLSTIGMHLPK